MTRIIAKRQCQNNQLTKNSSVSQIGMVSDKTQKNPNYFPYLTPPYLFKNIGFLLEAFAQNGYRARWFEVGYGIRNCILNTIKKPNYLIVRLNLRSEPDSNRCSSFCRAEPSHSAI